MITRYRELFVGALVLCLLPSLPSEARDIEERFKTGSNARLDLSNVSGDIQVFGWDRDEVLIEGELADNAEMELDQVDRRVTIKVVKKKGSRRMGSTELRVQVPFTSELSLYGVSADIDVEDVRGTQRIEVVSGDIDVRGFDDDLRIRSVNGDVVLRGRLSPGLITVVSVSGDIDVREVAGQIEITSISGNMRIVGGEFSRARLNSTSGNVEFVGAIATDGRLGIENLSGEIDIDLLDDDGLDVDIESFSGDIRNCLGEDVRRKRKHGPGQILRFSRGTGDRELRVQTLSGDVGLCAE